MKYVKATVDILLSKTEGYDPMVQATNGLNDAQEAVAEIVDWKFHIDPDAVYKAPMPRVVWVENSVPKNLLFANTVPYTGQDKFVDQRGAHSSHSSDSMREQELEDLLDEAMTQISELYQKLTTILDKPV